MSRVDLHRSQMVDWKKMWWRLAVLAGVLLCGGLLWSWAGCGMLQPSQTSQAQQQGNVQGDMTWSQQFVQQSQFDKATLGGVACLLVMGFIIAGAHFKGAHTIRAHLIAGALEAGLLIAAMMLFGIL